MNLKLFFWLLARKRPHEFCCASALPSEGPPKMPPKDTCNLSTAGIAGQSMGWSNNA